MSAPEGEERGLLPSLRRIAGYVLGLAESRLHLASLELQSEKLRLIDTLLQLAVALAVGAVGLLLGTFTLALYVWQTARYAGLLIMTAIFLVAAAFLIWRLRDGLRRGPKPFEKTINEFKKDRACFTTGD